MRFCMLVNLDLWEFRQLDENVEKESVGLKLVEKLDNM